MHATVNISLKAARDAAEVLAHNANRLDRVKVIEQEGGQRITSLHADVEKTMLFHLQKAWPDYSVLSTLSGYTAGKDENNVWLIDPLCGVDNYLHGFGHFCVSIALRTAGRVCHGVLVNPMLREEFTASRGTGAQVNTQRLRVSPAKSLENGMVCLDATASDAGLNGISLSLQQKLQLLHCDVRLGGCAALDLAFVAAGRMDAGWLSDTDAISIAAALLILQESGALISDATGNPVIDSSAELVFGNPKCFKQLLQLRQASSKVA